MTFHWNRTTIHLYNCSQSEAIDASHRTVFLCRLRSFVAQTVFPTPRNNTCLQCGKKFAGIQFLHIHEAAHRGDYPYRCEICEKGSFTMSNLKQHMTTHDGVRDYKCSECTQEFTRACSLKRHVHNLHQGK